MSPAETARDHIVDPVDRLAPAVMALSVSKLTGLLDLPGGKHMLFKTVFNW
jgi:hypothetical protein